MSFTTKASKAPGRAPGVAHAPVRQMPILRWHPFETQTRRRKRPAEHTPCVGPRRKKTHEGPLERPQDLSSACVREHVAPRALLESRRALAQAAQDTPDLRCSTATAENTPQRPDACMRNCRKQDLPIQAQTTCRLLALAQALAKGLCMIHIAYGLQLVHARRTCEYHRYSPMR